MLQEPLSNTGNRLWPIMTYYDRATKATAAGGTYGADANITNLGYKADVPTAQKHPCSTLLNR